MRRSRSIGLYSLEPNMGSFSQDLLSPVGTAASPGERKFGSVA
jgi:hypothetical protein